MGELQEIVKLLFRLVNAQEEYIVALERLAYNIGHNEASPQDYQLVMELYGDLEVAATMVGDIQHPWISDKNYQ